MNQEKEETLVERCARLGIENCNLSELVDRIEAAERRPAGEVCLTYDSANNLVAVTRQDEEGRILSVLWESNRNPDLPRAEERWHVALPGAFALSTVEVLEVTPATVLLREVGSASQSRYAFNNVQFVERVVEADKQAKIERDWELLRGLLETFSNGSFDAGDWRESDAEESYDDVMKRKDGAESQLLDFLEQFVGPRPKTGREPS